MEMEWLPYNGEECVELICGIRREMTKTATKRAAERIKTFIMRVAHPGSFTGNRKN
jgi:hypothetical protein